MLNYKTFFPWHLGKLKKVTNGLGFGQSSKKAGAIQKICFILKEPSVIPTLLAHLLRHIVKQCLLFEPTSVNMPSATRSGYSVVETTLKQLENKIYLSKWIHSNYQQSVTFGLYTLFFLKKPTRLEVQIFAVLVLFQSILSGAAKIASLLQQLFGIWTQVNTKSPPSFWPCYFSFACQIPSHCRSLPTSLFSPSYHGGLQKELKEYFTNINLHKNLIFLVLYLNSHGA